jgi:hypothetical protein
VRSDWGWRPHQKWRANVAGLMGRSERWLTSYRESPEQRVERLSRLLERQVRWWGESGFPTTNSRAELADSLEEVNRFDAALALREQIYSAYRDHVGEADRASLTAQSYLARTLYRSGRKAQAWVVAQDIKKIAEASPRNRDFFDWANGIPKHTQSDNAVSSLPTSSLGVPSSPGVWTDGQSGSSSTETARIWTNKKPPGL